MKKPRLDATDTKILTELQSDGRISNVELARRVGISPPPCLRRVRALEAAGFVQGYHAQIDNALLGFGVTVFAMVGLHSQAEADLQEFEARIAKMPEVRECYMLNGDIDFILKCVTPDLESFQRFLTEKLTPAPNVANVRTSLSIRKSKPDAGVAFALIK
ncbi:MAG: Lrp/AsnC family transcriptional regulator [Alphaproteobacteria bacterium]|nr:Lrp/AsnC family transcriptional regulator [Alphaproteobacteria bacterium]MBE8221080.1 Lrp/AsnC family transcriptional regulator [Alphaproteobacteria bacterium]